MTTKLSKKFIALFTAVLFCFCTFAEPVIDETFGYALDIPEGYELTATTNDNLSYAFNHKNLPVTLAVKIYDSTEDAHSVLQTALQKIGSKDEAGSFDWNKNLCAISKVNFAISDGQEFGGWAVCAPTKLKGYFLTLLCYAPKSISDRCDYFIMSTLNSLQIGDSKSTGIITDFAYPKQGKQDVQLTIGGKKIKTTIDKSDAEAAGFVVNIEFAVLSMYANHPKKVEAWKRYYRLIYRDSYARLHHVSDDIYKALSTDIKAKYPNNTKLGYAQTLLSWVQTFDYKRAKEKTSSDFTPLPAILTGEGSDCDSRSMLVSLMLNAKKIPSVLLLSPAYSHAMAGTEIKAPGQTFVNTETNKEYLMGETTAKVTWGTIAQDHADKTKWFAIELEN